MQLSHFANNSGSMIWFTFCTAFKNVMWTFSSKAKSEMHFPHDSQFDMLYFNMKYKKQRNQIWWAHSNFAFALSSEFIHSVWSIKGLSLQTAAHNSKIHRSTSSPPAELISPCLGAKEQGEAPGVGLSPQWIWWWFWRRWQLQLPLSPAPPSSCQMDRVSLDEGQRFCGQGVGFWVVWSEESHLCSQVRAGNLADVSPHLSQRALWWHLCTLSLGYFHCSLHFRVQCR